MAFDSVNDILKLLIYNCVRYSGCMLKFLKRILFNPKVSITANVSPGESGSFNSSKAKTLPLTSLGLISF